MKANIRIRTAITTDLETLYLFEQGIVEAERPMDKTLRTGEIHYYDIEEMIKRTDVEVIVAEDINTNELVGSAYVAIRDSKPYWTHDRHGYLGFMYVKPEYRGQGINGGIMNSCIAWAKSQDLHEVQLDVYPTNEPAMRAYEKAGFTSHLLKLRKSI